MYKSTAELRAKNEDIYARILRVMNIVHDWKTGFRGILHVIYDKIKDSKNKDLSSLYASALTKMGQDSHKIEEKIAYGVFEVIEELEQIGTINSETDELNLAEKQIYEDAVFSKTQEILQDIVAGKKLPVDMNIAETRRFNFTPKQMHKYHFAYACDHMAMLFAYENARLGADGIPADDIKFIITTRWNALYKGNAGHVVPCVKMADKYYYGFDPQNNPDENFEFIIPGYTETGVRGMNVHHVLKGYDAPHMITTDLISPSEYQKKYVKHHDSFIREASRVAYDDMVAYLQSQIGAGNLTATQVEQYLTSVHTQRDFDSGTHTIAGRDRKNMTRASENTRG